MSGAELDAQAEHDDRHAKYERLRRFEAVAEWFVCQMEEIRNDESAPVGSHKGLALEAERRLRAVLAGQAPEPSPLWAQA